MMRNMILLLIWSPLNISIFRLSEYYEWDNRVYLPLRMS
jgi:hypothetical protein